MDEHATELLARVLRYRLGHAGPWPSEASRFVQRRAAAMQVEPIYFLRTIEGRPDDLKGLIAAATIAHTAFFRHPDQIDRLREVLPSIALRRGVVRIWSAGCATGEEPWTLALVAESVGADVEILATDVSAAALDKAKKGFYEPRETRMLPGFDGARPFRVPDSLRARVRFEEGSLLGPGRMGVGASPFDVIFCRNVLIYFEPTNIDRAWEVFDRWLSPEGSIIVSPVEALLRVPEKFRQAGPLGWFERGSRRVEEPTIPRIPSSLPVSASPDVEDAEVIAAFERVARLLRANENDAAERLLHEVLAGRDDALGWFLLGETCARRGERTQARIAYERAARAQVIPTSVDLPTVRGAALRRARQLEHDG